MVDTHFIPDPNVYTQSMLKPLIDKMFFVDKVEAGLFIDYGCADGALCNILGGLFPDHQYLGYDESEAMIGRALHNKSHSHVDFTSSWADVEARMAEAESTCLILSSVIHEVYSYGDIEPFWQRVWGSGFDSIAIRDMMVSRAASRAADPISVARIRQLFDADKLSQWEHQWGSINENWSLLHFLLTYRYDANWVRELRENYLPHAVEDFLRLIPRNYKPIYQEHFTLPFLRRQVKTDFDIIIPDATHFKLILERS